MSDQLRPFLLVPAAFVVVGLLLTYLSIRGRRAAKAFRARAHRAAGLVTAVRTRSDRNRAGADTGASLSHYPVVRFLLPDGREVETETPGANPAPAKEGAQVTVLYDPASPTDAVIDSPWSDGRTLAGCTTAFGIAFTVLGVLFGAAMLGLRSID